MRRQGPGTKHCNRYNKYWPEARYSIFIQMFLCLNYKIHRFCTFHVHVLTFYTFFGPEQKYSWLTCLLKLSCRYFFLFYICCIYFNETWWFSDQFYKQFSFIFIFTVILSSGWDWGLGKSRTLVISTDPWGAHRLWAWVAGSRLEAYGIGQTAVLYRLCC